MAQHEVRFTVPRRRQVLSGDIVFDVWGEVKLGRLKVSQGGLDWFSTNRKIPTGSHTWEAFDALMRREESN